MSTQQTGVPSKPEQAERFRPDGLRGEYAVEEKGYGWVMFAGIMVGLAGILNVIWGIAAIDNSRYFTGNTTYILSTLNTWGWVVLVLGAIEICAAVSIFAGGQFGRWFGMIAAACNAIAVMLALAGNAAAVNAHVFWAFVLIALDVLVIYGLATYGGRRYEA